MRARILIPTLAAFCGGLLGCDRAVTNLPASDRPSFITYGSLDGNTHPAVVLLVMDIAGEPAFRCSGTLIAPKVVLTAGHCAGEPGEFSGMRVFTESDVENGTNNYPFAGPNTVEAKEWHSHPLFTEAQFFVHDVGVVLLSRAVRLSASEYGKLPRADQLDALQPRSSTLFTAVGYGLQKINPVFIEAEKVRMFAEPWLVQINTPGLTSFGLNGTCGGTGGVFRLDRKNVLDFVNQYLN